ncbi:hypothetical protein TorRG33x02_308890 [Trema orientale]|uniref:Uncharacterized protein n=1 Tax=Trema orientale TaxID=63057 RepID=A0A2P5BU11_TREOI|nr:hypothetical protein TorRG33x02_308890 [Trema orientale]
MAIPNYAPSYALSFLQSTQFGNYVDNETQVPRHVRFVIFAKHPVVTMALPNYALYGPSYALSFSQLALPNYAPSYALSFSQSTKFGNYVDNETRDFAKYPVR